MKVTIRKHFDYLTPFDEAETDDELRQIMALKYPAACGKLKTDAGFFARMVADVQKYEAWRVVGFDSFKAFCEAKLGKTIAEVGEIVAGVKVLASLGNQAPTETQAKEAARLMNNGGDRRSEGFKSESNQFDIIKLKHKGGTQASYIIGRLTRDGHASLAEDVKAGKLSARAAGIQVGIVKVQSPLELAIRAFRKLNDNDRVEFERRKGVA